MQHKNNNAPIKLMPTLSSWRIAFMGMGHMGSALITGLIKAKWPVEQLLILQNPKHPKKNLYPHAIKPIKQIKAEDLGCFSPTILIIAVKPQDLSKALDSINFMPTSGHCIAVSVVAGITLAQLTKQIDNPDLPIVRVMPNLAAQCLSSATAIVPGPNVSKTAQQLVNDLFKQVGITVSLEDESLLHAVTALSGSGPAYFFQWMSELSNTAQTLGLPKTAADALACQTAMGAAQLAQQSNHSWADLIRSICVKGGTTEAALKAYKRTSGIDEERKAAYNETHIKKMMFAAYERSVAIANNHSVED
jgi:pyrroline-5-carboxylate reductase